MSEQKELFSPEIAAGADSWLDEDEQVPDPWFRPDLCSEVDGADSPYLLPVPEVPTEPCPCCGADIPENPSVGYICPLCWWEIDPFVMQDDEPSDLNHGLSLDEARLNFHTFGVSNPEMLQYSL